MVPPRAGDADAASAAEQLGNRTPSVLATANRTAPALGFTVRGLENEEP